MSTSVSWNGVTYTVPAVGDQNWGGSSGADGLLISLAQNGFQKTGGLFSLSADVDFGPTNGPVTTYFKSRSANIAQSGVFRLANGDSVSFRNAANNADLALTVNSSNNLLFGGNQLLSSTGALTNSTVLIANGSGVITSSSVSTTTLGYLDATSSIQTQLNAKQATGSYITALTGDVTASGPGSVAATLTPIINSQVASGAAIAYSKLNLANSLLNADISASAAIVRTKLAASVSARYTNNSTASVPNSATVFNFASVDYDPSSIVSTGAAWKMTVPAGYGGKWRISASATVSSSLVNSFTIEILKNGATSLNLLPFAQYVAASFATPVLITDLVNLAAGDYIQIRISAFTTAVFVSPQTVTCEYVGS